MPEEQLKQQMHLTLPSCRGVKPGSCCDPAGGQWQQGWVRGCRHCPHASPQLGSELLLLLAKNSLELFLTALPREMAQGAVGKCSSWQRCLWDREHRCGFVKVPLCVYFLQLDVFIVRGSFSSAALKRVSWILLLAALKPLGLCFSSC